MSMSENLYGNLYPYQYENPYEYENLYGNLYENSYEYENLYGNLSISV